jgi:glycerol-3-phosphate O-acyltransferase
MLKEHHDNDGIAVEVFVEGSRSRDRRYLKPKTGFLRCLSVAGGEYVVVPIAINYEEIPEQTHLARDVDQGGRSRLNCRGLLAWLKVRF